MALTIFYENNIFCMSGRNENRMNNPVGRQLYQEIDPFLQENVPTSFSFHFLDFEPDSNFTAVNVIHHRRIV